MHRVNRMVLVATLAVFVVTQTFCLVAASYAEGGSVSGLHVQAAMQAMQSPKVFTNVMEQLNDIAMTLKTGQEEDVAMLNRVRDRCDGSAFRITHALEMIEKDCGGLKEQESAIEKQINSLRNASTFWFERFK